MNQGDALEHNFSALHSALLFPVTHLICGTPLQQVCSSSILSEPFSHKAVQSPSNPVFHGLLVTPVFCSGGAEVDAVCVVQAVQSVCPLLGAGGHGRGEHLLRGVLCKDELLDRQRCPKGEWLRGKTLKYDCFYHEWHS